MPSSNSAPRMSAARRTGPAVLVCVIVFACKRHLEQTTPGAWVATVEVTPPTATVPVGQTVQLTATAQDSTDAPLPERPVTWTSDNPAIESVELYGLATGKTAGRATITATSERQRGTAEVTVTARPPGSGEVLVGAGDIADCGSRGAEATAALLGAIPRTVFTAGDNAYSSGTASEYANCYDPTWGRHK